MGVHREPAELASFPAWIWRGEKTRGVLFFMVPSLHQARAGRANF